MKITIVLISLLFSLNSFGQKRTWEYASRMQSGFYQSDSCFVVFEATKGEQDVKIKCKIIKTPILSPVFIFTNKGNFTLHFTHVNKFGFYVAHFYIRNQNIWTALDSGITEIRFFSGKRWYYVKINDNLNKLKDYAN